MDIATVKKQYGEFMKRWKAPKTVEVPTEVITTKKKEEVITSTGAGYSDRPLLLQEDRNMLQINFEYEKLNKDDKKIYDAMNESERQAFEKTWIMIETQKAKLVQQKNRSKERNRREQKILSEKKRKERTHRLIERGAILESFLRAPETMTNEQVKALLEKKFKRNNEGSFSIKENAEETKFSQPRN